MNVVDAVTEVVSRVRALGLEPEAETTRLREEIANLPGMKTADDVHRYLEYSVQVGWGGGLENEAAALERVRPLDLAAAPEVAALLPTAEGFVLVRRYRACAGESLVNVKDSAAAFSASASARFRSEMRRLFEHGLFHPYARGFAHWWVAQPSGTIVLDSWFALNELDEDDVPREMALVERRLAERAAP